MLPHGTDLQEDEQTCKKMWRKRQIKHHCLYTFLEETHFCLIHILSELEVSLGCYRTLLPSLKILAYVMATRTCRQCLCSRSIHIVAYVSVSAFVQHLLTFVLTAVLQMNLGKGTASWTAVDIEFS